MLQVNLFKRQGEKGTKLVTTSTIKGQNCHGNVGEFRKFLANLKEGNLSNVWLICCKRNATFEETQIKFDFNFLPKFSPSCQQLVRHLDVIQSNCF